MMIERGGEGYPFVAAALRYAFLLDDVATWLHPPCQKADHAAMYSDCYLRYCRVFVCVHERSVSMLYSSHAAYVPATRMYPFWGIPTGLK